MWFNISKRSFSLCVCVYVWVYVWVRQRVSVCMCACSHQCISTCFFFLDVRNIVAHWYVQVSFARRPHPQNDSLISLEFALLLFFITLGNLMNVINKSFNCIECSNPQCFNIDFRQSLKAFLFRQTLRFFFSFFSRCSSLGCKPHANRRSFFAQSCQLLRTRHHCQVSQVQLPCRLWCMDILSSHKITSNLDKWCLVECGVCRPARCLEEKTRLSVVSMMWLLCVHSVLLFFSLFIETPLLRTSGKLLK